MAPVMIADGPGHAPGQERVLIRMLDFSCAGESAGLERRLRRVPGVRRVAVNPVNEIAYVTFDPKQTNIDELEFVVAAAGFRVAQDVLPS